MNLILFESAFEQVRLEPGDPKGLHIRKVLRAGVGTKVFIGFVGGIRARAEVRALGEDGSVDLEIVGTESPPPALPIQLLIGLPRPHTAKRILFEAASMGVQALHFFEAERGEPSYARSGLWSSDEWKERLWLGTEQSFGTHLPEVSIHPDLQYAISHLGTEGGRIALDNYEAAGPINEVVAANAKSAVLAVGSERGWSPNERDTFGRNGWRLAHLGPHVLRSETACTVGVGVLASQLGVWAEQTRTEI